MRRRCRMESLEVRNMMALTVEMVKDLNVMQSDSRARELFSTDDQLFFITGPEQTQEEARLWASDGTEAGTVEITLPAGEKVSDFSIHRDASASKFYFVSRPVSGASGYTLWVSDGTNETTTPLVRLDYITKLRAHGERLYFVGSDDFQELNPWVSDGTAAGTRQVGEGEYPNNREASYSASLNGSIYFVDKDPSFQGYVDAIYRTDGTMEGTTMVVPATVDKMEIDFRESTAVGNRLFFRGVNASTGGELWATDGTAEGTYLVKDIVAGTQGSDLNDFTVVGGLLFFVVMDEFGVAKLWRSDGTDGGTYALDTPSPLRGGFDGAPSFAVRDDVLYFGARTDQRLELWRTDGTQEGSQRLPLGDDIHIGANLINVNGTLFATGANAVGEKVVWRTDGTAEGTIAVADLSNRFEVPSHRLALAAVQGSVFFNPTDRQTGGELWSIKAPPGDTNFDGLVDLTDLNNVRNYFGYEGDDFPGDVTGDGVVGLDDLNAVRNNFGAGGEALTSRARSIGGSVSDDAPSPAHSRAFAAAVDVVARLMGEEKADFTAPFRHVRKRK